MINISHSLTISLEKYGQRLFNIVTAHNTCNQYNINSENQISEVKIYFLLFFSSDMCGATYIDKYELFTAFFKNRQNNSRALT